MAKCVHNSAGVVHPTRETLTFWCEACRDPHRVTVNGPGTWTWDGNLQSPTISPSIKVTWNRGEEKRELCCHSFVRNGQIEYCGDCTHALAGKKVPMIDVDTDGFAIDTNRSSSETKAASGETGATPA